MRDLEHGESRSATHVRSGTRRITRLHGAVTDAATRARVPGCCSARSSQQAWMVQGNAMELTASLECDASVHRHDEADAAAEYAARCGNGVRGTG